MRRINRLLSLFLMFALAGAALAAEPTSTDTRKVRPVGPTAPTTAPPAAGAKPSLSVTPKPLQMVLTRNMVAIQPLSLCVTVPNAVNAVLDKELTTRDTLKSAGLSGHFALSRSKLHSYFLPAVNYCCAPSTSFSVQDQQAAGCTGSDTVSACMEKLTRACIHKHVTALHVKEETQQQQQAVSAVSSVSGQYAQKLQQLLSTLP